MHIIFDSLFLGTLLSLKENYGRTYFAEKASNAQSLVSRQKCN